MYGTQYYLLDTCTATKTRHKSACEQIGDRMAEHQDPRCNPGGENDVKRRMQLAELPFRRMFELFAGIRASIGLKVKVWIILVHAVLLYGCGAWGLTAALTEKL